MRDRAMSAATRTSLEWEFMMLASTKRTLIAIAVTVALAILLAPPSASAASSKTATTDNPAPFRSGDLVRLSSGGPLMTVIGIEGDQVNCAWTDFDGNLQSERLPRDALERGIRIIGGFRRPIPDGS